MTHEVQSGDRKHLLSVIALWLGVAVLSVIIALAIGNVLGDKADKLPNSPSVPANLYKYTGEDVQPIDAWLISLYGQTPEKLEAEVSAMPDSVRSVSLYLRSNGGATAYASAIYSAVTGNASGGMSLKEAVELLHKNGYYVSGCFDIGAPKLAGKDGCDALVGFETALICEALESGIDELILLGLPSGQDSIYITAGMFESIRKKHPDAVLGAGIDYKLMLSDAGAEALLGYSEFADFCALDTSGAKAVGSNAVQIVKSLTYIFETYPIRLLFECSSDADRQAQADALRQLGITNIQSHKISTVGAPAG